MRTPLGRTDALLRGLGLTRALDARDQAARARILFSATVWWPPSRGRIAALRSSSWGGIEHASSTALSPTPFVHPDGRSRRRADIGPRHRPALGGPRGRSATQASPCRGCLRSSGSLGALPSIPQVLLRLGGARG